MACVRRAKAVGREQGPSVALDQQCPPRVVQSVGQSVLGPGRKDQLSRRNANRLVALVAVGSADFAGGREGGLAVRHECSQRQTGALDRVPWTGSLSDSAASLSSSVGSEAHTNSTKFADCLPPAETVSVLSSAAHQLDDRKMATAENNRERAGFMKALREWGIAANLPHLPAAVNGQRRQTACRVGNRPCSYRASRRLAPARSIGCCTRPG